MSIVSFTDYTPIPRYDGLPWTVARIEEATSPDGPWTLVEGFSLSPVDADPANPAPRSFTTELATLDNGWYRLVWVDSAANESATAPQGSPPVAFASADDLAARLGVAFTEEERARAQLLLQLASGIIQQETKQTISHVAADIYTRPGDYDTRIRLPERPVLNVSSVVLDGVTLEEGVNYFVDRDELVRLNWNAVIQDSSFGLPWAGWGFPWWRLVVTYDHGYETIPELARTICMEMVVRVWVNPGSVARESVGNTMTVYDNNRFSPAGMLLTDEEKKQLNRFFRRHSGSIALR